MATIGSSMRTINRPSVSCNASKRPSAFHSAFYAPARRVGPPARLITVYTTEPSEPRSDDLLNVDKEEKKKEEYSVPHLGRAAPMSEDKRSAAEQQGAAPEGDRAIIGQAWQPTGDSKETPEDRYGSAEAAAEAMEAAKDRSRKSELQTSDDTAKTPGGGNTGEGSSA